jgi:hypothetical protein
MITDPRIGPLPLRETAIDWCDNLLACTYVAASGDHELLLAMRARKQSPPSEHRYARLSPMFFDSEVEFIQRAAKAAEKALIVDLRARVATGEIVLSGWSTVPAADLRPVTIPSELAEEVHFQLWMNTVVVRGTRYDRVSATRTACAPGVSVEPILRREEIAGGSIPRAAAEVGASVPDKAAAKGTTPRGDVSTGKVGRPRFPLDAMVELALDLKDPERLTHKVAAHHLVEAFRVKHPGRRLPTVSTTEDRLLEIYRRRAEALSGRNP